MPVPPIKWIEQVDVVELTTIGDEEQVILYVEDSEPLRIRHRVSLADFRRIFNPVFLTVDSWDEVTPEDFREVLGQNPDAEIEHIRRDIGYNDVIDYWEREGVFGYLSSGSSAF